MISSGTQDKESNDRVVDAVSRITTDQIDQANASGRTPVVFVHGLWLLPSSWDRWAALFDEAGYRSVTPGWPDDPETVDGSRAD
jgi:non-heme chloroperoxidase